MLDSQPIFPRHTPKRRPPGAPRGNLNGLKSGRASKQLQLLAAVIAARPDLTVLDRKGRGPLMRLLIEAIRDDRAAYQQAQERARRILEPYKPERLVDRIAHRLIVAAFMPPLNKRSRSPKTAPRECPTEPAQNSDR